MKPAEPGSDHWRDGNFHTTRWSLVLRAGNPGTETADHALRDLYQAYWYPLYSFIRRQGKTPHEAEDLAQGFFPKLLEKNYVADADQDRGKFRSFLLVALKHFLANEWDKQHAQKRGGFGTMVEIDQVMAETRLDSELRSDLSPENLFDRQWALLLLERVMNQLREEYIATGRAKLFEHLSQALDSPEARKRFLREGSSPPQSTILTASISSAPGRSRALR